MLVVSCCKPTSHISSFQFRNMLSFDTILLWYANIQHVNLRGVVNEMLIKQNINISSSCFITWSTNCQQNCWTAIVNNRHHSDLSREDITLPNLTKHDLDDDLRCQNEIDLWIHWHAYFIKHINIDVDNPNPEQSTNQYFINTYKRREC